MFIDWMHVVFCRLEYDAYRTEVETLNIAPRTEANIAKLGAAQVNFGRQKDVYDKLRGDVTVKLQFLDENRVCNFLSWIMMSSLEIIVFILQFLKCERVEDTIPPLLYCFSHVRQLIKTLKSAMASSTHWTLQSWLSCKKYARIFFVSRLKLCKSIYFYFTMPSRPFLLAISRCLKQHWNSSALPHPKHPVRVLLPFLKMNES